jgi:hypothetical protein
MLLEVHVILRTDNQKSWNPHVKTAVRLPAGYMFRINMIYFLHYSVSRCSVWILKGFSAEDREGERNK